MRFYFRLLNGEIYDDKEGAELPDLSAAEIEAAKIAGEWMSDNRDVFVHDTILKVEIYDARR